MNPWLILAAVIAVGSMTGYSYYLGGKHKENAIVAEQKRQDELIARVQSVNAEAIANIKVKNITVRQETEREIVHLPADCVAPDRLLELTNEAITGHPAARSSELPATGADDGQDVR